MQPASTAFGVLQDEQNPQAILNPEVLSGVLSPLAKPHGAAAPMTQSQNGMVMTDASVVSEIAFDASASPDR